MWPHRYRNLFIFIKIELSFPLINQWNRISQGMESRTLAHSKEQRPKAIRRRNNTFCMIFEKNRPNQNYAIAGLFPLPPLDFSGVNANTSLATTCQLARCCWHTSASQALKWLIPDRTWFRWDFWQVHQQQRDGRMNEKKHSRQSSHVVEVFFPPHYHRAHSYRTEFPIIVITWRHRFKHNSSISDFQPVVHYLHVPLNGRRIIGWTNARWPPYIIWWWDDSPV